MLNNYFISKLFWNIDQTINNYSWDKISPYYHLSTIQQNKYMSKISIQKKSKTKLWAHS